MKHLTLLLSITYFLFTGIVYSQGELSHTVDSCRSIINNPDATLKDKTHARITMAEKYIYVHPDSSKLLLDEITNNLDATALLQRDTVHQHLLMYCYYYMGVDKYQTSLTYAEQVKELVFQKTNKSDKINSLLVMAYLYNEVEDPRFLKSIKELEEFCLPVEDEADANGFVMAKEFLGRYYRHQNRLDTALTILFNLVDTEAFKEATEFHSGVHQSIAYYLKSLGDTERAKVWYTDVAYSPDFDQKTRARAHLALGAIFVEADDFQKASFHVGQADSVGVTIERDQQMQLQLLATIAIEANNYQKAIDYVAQTQTIADDSEDLEDQITNAKLLAEANLGLKNYQQAISFANIFLTKVKSSKGENKPGLIARMLHTKLKAAALLKGDNQTAALLDSLNHQLKQYTIKRSSEAGRAVAAKYETDKITAENDLLKVRSLAAETAATNRKHQLWLVFALLTAVGTGLFFALRDSRRRQTLNAELAQKNSLITLQKADINHRTNGYLSNIVKLLKEQKYKLEEAGADPRALDELERQTLVYTKLQYLLTTIDDRTVVNLNEYLEQLTTLLLNSFQGGGMPLHLSLKVDAVNIDPKLAAPLALILNELMTNTAKYAARRGGITSARFQAKMIDSKTLLLNYEDDGPGNTNASAHFSSNTGLDLIEGLTHQMEAERLKADGYGYRARVEL